MRFGFQKGSLIFRFDKREMRITSAELFCLLAGVLLFAAAGLAGGPEPVEEGYVARREYGQGEEETSLLVNGLEEKPFLVEFSVAEQQYTEAEAKAAMDDLESRLEEMILGANPDLAHIRSDLYLKTEDPATGLTLRWSSDSPELLDTDGKVNGEHADETGGSPVELRAELRDSQGRFREVCLSVRVYPPVLSPGEEAKAGLLQQIQRREEDTRTDSGFYLPEEYEGRKLTYQDPESSSSAWILIMGIAAALLLRTRQQNQEKEKKKQRDRQLLLDYSELVSRLQIFLGAGMTVHTAWEKIAEDYLESRKRGGEERPAYEEVAQTCSQIRSGAPEGRAYEEFGRRCGLPPYLKLAGLLEQNRRTGGKNLRQLLTIEVTDAFEQRKNLARRQGEEASARLLLPLFMMLGIVMVIVSVPAFLSFS